MKLYIIGNGFDLYHYLPSAYNDFKGYLKEKDPHIFEILERYFNYDGTFWHAFEINLSRLDEFGLVRDELSSLGIGGWDADSIESYRSNLEYYTIDMFYILQFHMIDWVRSLNLMPISKRHMDIDSNALFISFNYTNTLERYYNIKSNQINYIHGSGHKENCDLVFGHDMDESDIDYEVKDNQEGQGRLIVKSFLEHSRKPTEKIIKENQSFWDKLSFITDIIIIGHSLSTVDMPYFKTIVEHVNKKCSWKVSYYNELEIKNHINTLIDCGVNPQLIYPFNIYKDRPKQGALF